MLRISQRNLVVAYVVLSVQVCIAFPKCRHIYPGLGKVALSLLVDRRDIKQGYTPYP